MVGVAKICSDAGKVNKELRLGVSSSTSLDNVGSCWFPSSLDELGPGGATTGSVVTELGLFGYTRVGLSWNCSSVRR